MTRGLILVALGIAIIPAWIFLLGLVFPDPAGPAIKISIVFSIIPFILAPALFLWGLAHLLKLGLTHLLETRAARSRVG